MRSGEKMEEAHGEILRLGAGGVQARAEQRAHRSAVTDFDRLRYLEDSLR